MQYVLVPDAALVGVEVLYTAKGKILIIDDDSAFTNQANEQLRDAGYEVLIAENGGIGLKRLYSHQPDLVLLDLTLPEMSGWEICKRIRDISDIPIIMLNSDWQKPDILKGFNLGADDFVNKPPDYPELIARLRALLRRSISIKWNKITFNQPEMEVDWKSHQVFIRGHLVKLSPTEFKLLTCLIENRGWLVTHGELLRRVWGSDYLNDKNFVKLYVRYLRQKIEEDPSRPKLILTERGIGYRFSNQVKEAVI